MLLQPDMLLWWCSTALLSGALTYWQFDCCMQVPLGWVWHGEPLKSWGIRRAFAACGETGCGWVVALSDVLEQKMLALVPAWLLLARSWPLIGLVPKKKKNNKKNYPLQQTEACHSVTPDKGGSESLDNKFTGNTITAPVFSVLPNCSFCWPFVTLNKHGLCC